MGRTEFPTFAWARNRAGMKYRRAKYRRSFRKSKRTTPRIPTWSPTVVLGQIMLNFAEQTGSGAVMIVWSFLSAWDLLHNVNVFVCHNTLLSCFLLWLLTPNTVLLVANKLLTQHILNFDTINTKNKCNQYQYYSTEN